MANTRENRMTLESVKPGARVTVYSDPYYRRPEGEATVVRVDGYYPASCEMDVEVRFDDSPHDTHARRIYPVHPA